MDITSLQFEDPWVLWLLVAVGAGLVVNLWRSRRPGAGLLFPSLGLVPLTRAGWRVRMRWLLVVLRVAAMTAFVVALARPQIVRASVESVAEGMREDRMLRTFLESPKIAAAQKIEILQKALGKRVPHLFLRFLETVIMKRRQMVIPSIASEYRALIDESEDRVHATVVVAREPAEPEKDALKRQLSRLFGKRVVPHYSLNPAILGGVIVKVGDTVMDGSVRRRLATLKSRMLASAAR